MKNLLVQSGKLMFTGVMSAALVLGSCQKEEVNEQVQNDRTSIETIQTIENLSTDFIDSQRGGVGFDRKPNWWKIAGKDLLGAVGGAIAGSVVGAVLGGVGASLVEAGEQHQAAQGIAPGGGNAGNGYDYVGESHVAILEAGLGADRDLIFDGTDLLEEEFLAYAKGYLIAEGTFTPDDLDFYTVEMLNTDIAFANDFGDGTTVDAIIHLRDIGSLSEVEADILIPYYEAYEAASNYEDFHAFSVDSENAVMDDPSLSEESKELILANMSTTRHDLNYWNEFE